MKNDNVIQRLTGPERVRLRPAVIFGDLGTAGVLYAIKQLLDIFAFEAKLGHCSEISIRIQEDHVVEIRCNDRGLCLDDAPVDGEPAWRRTFCALDLAPRTIDEEFYSRKLSAVHNELYGDWNGSSPVQRCTSDHRMDLCCIQYACEFLHVESVTGFVRRTMDFIKGNPVFEPACDVTCEQDGTYLRFRLDTEVFGEYKISVDALVEYLSENFPPYRGLHYSLTCAN